MINNFIESKLCTLYSLANWQNGLAFKNITFSNSGLPIIKIAELKNGITDQTKFTQDKFDNNVFLMKGDMLFSWSGNPETSIDTFIYNLPEGWLNQHIFKVTPKNIDTKYFYYVMKSLNPVFKRIASNKQTTGLGHVTVKDLKEIEIYIPSHKEQQHIVNILGTIDDKIENNENLIAKINESTKLYYINFCDNGFVDDVLENYIENYDRQRKPLSSRERDSLEKIYPYYGATEVLDYVDNYLFDGDYLLMGEDGTVADSLGFPIVQRVNEKFWANNHTHILKAKNGIDNNVLELILKNTNVQSIITGAVQPKINQANMNSLKIKIPNNVDILMKTIYPYFEKRQSLIVENKNLTN